MKFKITTHTTFNGHCPGNSGWAGSPLILIQDVLKQKSFTCSPNQQRQSTEGWYEAAQQEIEDTSWTGVVSGLVVECRTRNFQVAVQISLPAICKQP